jgi:hypothetical protein
MSQHRAKSKDKLAGDILLGAVASGLAAAALTCAGTASATCASISGIGNSTTPGNFCTSTPTSFAVGLGNNVTAESNGLFSGAIAVGLTNTGTQFTTASALGNFTIALAAGPNTVADAGSPANPASTNFNYAAALGSNVRSFAGQTPGDTFNFAFNIANEPSSNGNTVVAGGDNVRGGFGNTAVNLFGTAGAGSNTVEAIGNLNNATNLGGSNNFVHAGQLGVTFATLSSASNFFGTTNTVAAGPGPLAIASALGGTGKTITQTGPGFNIG